ncbi:DUF6314 family protein [Streptomyces sp. NEAU-S7GS2]|uniref:DUF6314 family protein n=1 Tax=Streptomyces sp. NEAU-S7GS2 TaxID=2202000 RepID=UPI000D700B46|nr:DUF6314 family protein [Streptomyces sp. NEAU-S7GS2]AWN30832.1 hypothetical protein DKG71_36390 [Streptomyces sp. NEAU-S7GS2]
MGSELGRDRKPERDGDRGRDREESATGRHPVPDVAAYLSGRWSIERTVHDLRTGAEGSFRGTAAFRPDAAGGGLLHSEEGQLSWGGTVAPVSRTLRVRPRPDGTAAIEFADGRPFHDLDLRTGRWTAVHPCAADRYEGTFTAVGPDTWHLEWRVGGPAKDQLLCSVYRRLG